MAMVSVIIPCYNQGHYLAESIGSVLASDFSDIEIIVVDDGSTDSETCAVLDRLDYPKTRLIQRNNGGLSAARNSGIAAAVGKYILPLDSDDRIAPGYIGHAVSVLEQDAAVGIVYCKAEKFGAEQGAWRLPRFSRFRMALGNVIFCTAMYRRHDWQAVGGYDESLRRGWEDWDFWLSLLGLGRMVHQLPEVGFYYRKNVSSMAAGMDGGLKAELHGMMLAKHREYLGLWGGVIRPLLKPYYAVAASKGYQWMKKKAGR